MSHIVTIHFVNGSKDECRFGSYSQAREFWRKGISYSGGRVKRVEYTEETTEPRVAGVCAMAIWDINWTEVSKNAGLELGERY